MWQPEYLHHASREGINIRKHGDDLEIATIPREAKFYFWGEPAIAGGPDSESHFDLKHARTPIRDLPTANLFLAEFSVDTTQMSALAASTSSLERDVRNFLLSCGQFYKIVRCLISGQGPTVRGAGYNAGNLNIYERFEDFMNHPRYHVGTLVASIEEQIEGEDGEEAHKVRNLIKRIQALLRTSEQELHELNVKEEYDEDVEKEEPIYFTTWEDKKWIPPWDPSHPRHPRELE